MVANMDEVVALAEKCSTLFEVQKELIPALKKLEKSSAPVPAASNSNKSKARSSEPLSILESMLKDDTDPLERIAPDTASVAYLFILNARCHLATSTPDIEVWGPLHMRIKSFVEAFQPAQLCLVPEQVVFFAKQLIFAAESHGDPIKAAEPLKVLVERYAPAGTLTAIHPIFLQFVLRCRLHAYAKDLLRTAIDDVNISVYPLKYQEHLAYHYLGGVILCLAGDHATATEMLETCVSAPGNGTSAIQIDAYKKLVLIQLLVGGNHVTLPAYTNSATTSACKAASGPYIAFATAYIAADGAGLQRIIDTDRENFIKDLNYGLILVLQKSFRRRLITRLTETFLSVSLDSIATTIGLTTDEAGLAQAEEEVLSMFEEKHLFGSLSESQTDGAAKIITFTADPEPYDSHETVERITRAVQRAENLNTSLRMLDGVIGRSSSFVHKAYDQAGNGSSMDGGLGTAPDSDVHMDSKDWAEGMDDDS